VWPFKGCTLFDRGEMDKEVYVIDGDNFDTLEGFYDEISNKVIPGASWGRNLMAFNDILRGGFGTISTSEGFILVWKHAARSREVLGYHFGNKEYLPIRKPKRRHPPEHKAWLRYDFLAYGQEEDQTIYELLVEVIERNPNVELRLE
jgi:RNAse (barnase) inhibitor barstar